MKKKWLLCWIGTLMLSLSLCACSQKEEKQEEQADASALSAFSTFPDTVPSFSTVDLEGNTVTEKIFEEADLTVINFWGTYCNPCIDEMDELGEWAGEMPENVQLIGVAVDVSLADAEACATAKQIVEETGAAYTQLMAGDAFDEILDEMVAVPTTFFVDREGNLVCEPVVGADVEAYKEAVEEYFNGNK